MKEKNHIIYNPENEFIDDEIEPNTVPRNIQDPNANSVNNS